MNSHSALVLIFGMALFCQRLSENRIFLLQWLWLILASCGWNRVFCHVRIWCSLFKQCVGKTVGCIVTQEVSLCSQLKVINLTVSSLLENAFNHWQFCLCYRAHNWFGSRPLPIAIIGDKLGRFWLTLCQPLSNGSLSTALPLNDTVLRIPLSPAMLCSWHDFTYKTANRKSNKLFFKRPGYSHSVAAMK